MLVAAGGVAGAATGAVYTATLVGTDETPPNASPATGLATVTLSSDETTITVDVNFSGLVAPATAGHIHGPAAPGVAAPVIFPFAGVPNATSGTVPEQSFPITAAQVADLKNGLYYVNIHSSVFPGGEIRGQLAPDPDQPGGLDHFACYDAAPLPGGNQPFTATAPVVGLQDEFGNDPQVGVAPLPTQVCNPAEKTLADGQVFGIQNPIAHLVCWPITRSVAPNQVLVSVKNQFGTAELSTTNAQTLCVPSWKVLGQNLPPVAGDTPPGLDHFECYQAKPASAATGVFANKPAFVLVSTSSPTCATSHWATSSSSATRSRSRFPASRQLPSPTRTRTWSASRSALRTRRPRTSWSAR